MVHFKSERLQHYIKSIIEININNRQALELFLTKLQNCNIVDKLNVDENADLKFLRSSVYTKKKITPFFLTIDQFHCYLLYRK